MRRVVRGGVLLLAIAVMVRCGDARSEHMQFGDGDLPRRGALGVNLPSHVLDLTRPLPSKVGPSRL